MAIDVKYGHVVLEHGDIGHDEPVFIFRAKDRLLIKVLEHYRGLCQMASSPVRHLDLIDISIDKIKVWQLENGTKTPTSEASREWMGE